MKSILIIVSVFVGVVVQAQKTLYFKQKTENLFNEFVGLYPTTLKDVAGIKHYQFEYNKAGKLVFVRQFGQGVKDYTNENAVKSFMARLVYKGDTVFQVLVSEVESATESDEAIIGKIWSGEMGANRLTYKNGKLHMYHNMGSYLYAKNYFANGDENGQEEDEAKAQALAVTVGYEYEYIGNTSDFYLYFLNVEGSRTSIEELAKLEVKNDKKMMTKTIRYMNDKNERISISNGVNEVVIGENAAGSKRYSLELNSVGEINSNEENALSKYLEVVDYDNNGYPNKYTRCDKNLKPAVVTYQVYLEDPETGEYVPTDARSYTDMRNILDANGNVLETSTFNDKGGKENFDLTFATTKNTYDKNGNLTSVRWYDANGDLALNGYYAGNVNVYDENNHLIESYNLGMDNKPSADDQGVYVRKMEYEGDQLLATMFYDANGTQMTDASGAHKYLLGETNYEEDPEGEFPMYDVYGMDEELLGKELVNAQENYEDGSFVFTRYKYDDQNRIISEKNFDAEHRPYASETMNFEGRYTYFDASELPGFAEDNVTRSKSEMFFDVEMNPTFKAYEGYHKLERKIEMVGSHYLTTTSYFNTDGNLITGDAVAIYIEETSVEEGVYNSYASNDAKNMPIVDAYGIWKVVHENEFSTGRSSTSYFDKNNKPAVNELKVHKEVTAVTGLETVRTFLDKKGKLMNCANGHAKSIEIFNENYATLSLAYYNKKGKPVVNKASGIHKTTNAYDEGGNVIEVNMLNKKGKLVDVTSWMWPSGFKAARVVRTYGATEEGYYNLEKETYYNAKGDVLTPPVTEEYYEGE